MVHVHQLHLETYVRGLYIVQEGYNVEQFARLVQNLPPSTAKAYQDAYTELQNIKAACLREGEESPWVIVIFNTDPRQTRRSTLHEVVHLADKLTHSRESRARFIEHVYFALVDTLAPLTRGPFLCEI